MSQASKLALLKEMLESALSNIRSAKQLLNELTPNTEIKDQFKKMAGALSVKSENEEGKIIEGIFDGQNMIGSDKKIYPVPANYSSKSKLIPGDVLKLTVSGDGAFLYKQIGPTERKRIRGPLVLEDEQHVVLAEGKAYKVLLASVTYFRAEVGDEVILIVPEHEDSDWGAIENVLPRSEKNI